MADLLGVARRGANRNNPTYQELKKGTIPSIDKIAIAEGSRGGGAITSIVNSVESENIQSLPWRLKCVLGAFPNNTESYRRMFDQSKYQFFLDAPEWLNISAKCCSVMKKAPIHKYTKEANKKPITAQMASESRLRTQQWLRNGCNGFDMKSPISNPMSFWTEQDVLLYIKLNNLPICSVYGEVVVDSEIDGQMSLFDYEGIASKELFELERPLLKTTGCSRTGCMFCGYGCHLEKGEGRFERMKRTHPKQYEYIMKPTEEGGLNYKNVINWINEHGNLNIRY